MLVEGLRFFITGAATGIGAGVARTVAREGGAVAITDIADEPGEQLAAEIRDTGGRAIYLHCDVSDHAALEAAIDRSAEELGGLDVLHNNAGVHDARLHPEPTLENVGADHFRQILESNLVAMWMSSKFALPHLRKSSNPSIINCGSVASRVGFAGGACYGASKGGVIALTKHLALDLAKDGIRVNCYDPGSIRTDAAMKYVEMVGEEVFLRTNVATNLVARIGEPEDIGNLVCFLASDKAGYITGGQFLCDGGSLAWRGTIDQLGMEAKPL